MAKAAKVSHKIAGYYELRRAPGTVSDLEQRARAVLAAAGGRQAGFKMRSRQGAKNPQGRHRVTVTAVKKRAKLRNERENTLINALDAGRG
ncbi:MAG: hypothetical protein ACI38R_22760 [Rhodococcus sp. (in: high G+C Gram-positive bacteria)]